MIPPADESLLFFSTALFTGAPASELRLAVEGWVVKRRKSIDHGGAKNFLPRNQIGGQHAPRALGIAHPGYSCEFVDRLGQLNAMIHNSSGQRVR